MINHPKVTQETCPELRLVMSGAAPIGLSDVERFKNKYVLIELYEMFDIFLFKLFVDSPKPISCKAMA